jgi:serine/threonine protein kinase
MTPVAMDSAELRSPERVHLAPGTVLAGKYRIERALGEGGFATVYAARHVSVASLRVAVKVLHHDHAESARSRTRFRREAELAASLQSRFIVRVLDAGELDDRRPFIAMEFVDGVPLDELLRRCGRLAPRDAARFVESVLRALEVAHAAGVVHRDLKPANVFAVEQDGDPPFGRVLDFGIAKAISGEKTAPRGSTTTVEGQVVCTPHYAAPDLLTGQVSPLVDIYALGHMAAELLEGYTPYGGGEESHAVLIAGRHLQPDPVPLGPFTLSSGIGHIVRRACEKDPALRYQSATEMLADLRAAMPGLAAHPEGVHLDLRTPYVLEPRDTLELRQRTTQPPVTAGGLAMATTDSLHTEPRRGRPPTRSIAAGIATLLLLIAAFAIVQGRSQPDAAAPEASTTDAPSPAVPASDNTLAAEPVEASPEPQRPDLAAVAATLAPLGASLAGSARDSAVATAEAIATRVATTTAAPAPEPTAERTTGGTQPRRVRPARPAEAEPSGDSEPAPPPPEAAPSAPPEPAAPATDRPDSNPFGNIQPIAR